MCWTNVKIEWYHRTPINGKLSTNINHRIRDSFEQGGYHIIIFRIKVLTFFLHKQFVGLFLNLSPFMVVSDETQRIMYNLLTQRKKKKKKTDGLV